jgi:hypothetical protein
MWDFRFSRRRVWSLETSGMQRRVVMFQRCVLPPSSGRWILPSISKPSKYSLLSLFSNQNVSVFLIRYCKRIRSLIVLRQRAVSPTSNPQARRLGLLNILAFPASLLCLSFPDPSSVPPSTRPEELGSSSNASGTYSRSAIHAGCGFPLSLQTNSRIEP